jgi:hypothetical protein
MTTILNFMETPRIGTTVILSAAKDLSPGNFAARKILCFAQDDNGTLFEP